MRIKNWEKFNLYKPRNPRYQKKMTWFKFYGTDYINDIEIHKLSFEQKAVLVEYGVLVLKVMAYYLTTMRSLLDFIILLTLLKK